MNQPAKVIRKMNHEPDLHFTRTNDRMDDMIDELIDSGGGVKHADLIREMIIAAHKTG